MSLKIRILLIALAIIIIGAVIVWLRVFRKSDTSVAGQKATIEITASALVNDYEINEDSANLKYNDKVISIIGMIAEVKESQENISLYLKENKATSGVMCSFDKGVVKKEDFKTGQEVKLKGICNGYLMDVVMNKCAIEN